MKFFYKRILTFSRIFVYDFIILKDWRDREMNEDLRKQLEIMNANLTAVVKNQAMIYAELKEIEGKIEKEAEG